MGSEVSRLSGMGHYEERVKGQSAEQILQAAGGGSSGAVTGPDGDFLRVAAQVHSTQELIAELQKASTSNTVVSTRVLWLTVVIAVAGVAQAIATAWPYLVWWLRHQ